MSLQAARKTRLPRTEPRSGSGSSRGAARVLQILDHALASEGTLRVSELVTDVGIPQSTAYELVRIMVDAGYLEASSEKGSFSLGRKLYELGMVYRSQVDLLKDGAEVVHALSRELGETVQLSVLDHDRMLVLLKEEGTRPLRIISKVGSRVPINWAAAGRLLVSDKTDEELRRWLPENIAPSPTGTAPLDVVDLVEQIRRFRAQGFGIEIGEANEHAGCVAAPVLDRDGKCIATVSVAAPEFRLSDSERPGIIATVREAAASLTRRLGGRSTADA